MYFIIFNGNKYININKKDKIKYFNIFNKENKLTIFIKYIFGLFILKNPIRILYNIILINKYNIYCFIKNFRYNKIYKIINDYFSFNY